jgi:hypothetical protein
MEVRSTAVPMATLNSIAGPAVAVEVAAPDGNVTGVATAEFQQTIASALANAIAASQFPVGTKQGGVQ